jgi:hypothetical protein
LRDWPITSPAKLEPGLAPRNPLPVPGRDRARIPAFYRACPRCSVETHERMSLSAKVADYLPRKFGWQHVRGAKDIRSAGAQLNSVRLAARSFSFEESRADLTEPCTVLASGNRLSRHKRPLPTPGGIVSCENHRPRQRRSRVPSIYSTARLPDAARGASLKASGRKGIGRREGSPPLPGASNKRAGEEVQVCTVAAVHECK